MDPLSFFGGVAATIVAEFILYLCFKGNDDAQVQIIMEPDVVDLGTHRRRRVR